MSIALRMWVKGRGHHDSCAPWDRTGVVLSTVGHHVWAAALTGVLGRRARPR